MNACRKESGASLEARRVKRRARKEKAEEENDGAYFKGAFD